MKNLCVAALTATLLRLAVAVLFSLLLINQVTAQTSSKATGGTTPPGIAAGAPAGSFELSDFDNVNPYSGNLNLHLPLLHMGGRGGAQTAMSLAIDSEHWTVERLEDSTTADDTPSCGTAENPCPHPPLTGGAPGSIYYSASPNSWEGIRPGYGPGVLQGRTTGRSGVMSYSTQYSVALTRLTFTASDGTEYELRDQLTSGRPANNTGQPFSRGTVFVTTDGTAATFISDAVIFENFSQGSSLLYPSGYLLLRDGTRYRIDNGLVTWIRDHNGNKASFTYDANSRVSTIIDSLNRQVTITYADMSTVMYDQINFMSFGGAARSIKIWHASLHQTLRPNSGYLCHSYNDLFPELGSGNQSVYDPNDVVSALELPDGRQYHFYYNPYGELSRVELPTGGSIEYDYTAGSGVITYSYQIYRRLIERRMYPSGGTGSAYASRQNFTATFDDPQAGQTSVLVEQHDANNTLLTSDRHRYYGNPAASLSTFPQPWYPAWNESKEYHSESLDTAGATSRQIDHSWQQRAPVSWWSSGAGLGPEPTNDPRLVETTTTLADANLVSKQSSINPQNGTIGFDQYNNQVDGWEYAYGQGAPGPLLRHTHTDYLTAGYDTNTDIHLRGLVQEQRVYGIDPSSRAETLAAATHNDYDQASLVDCPNISGHDAAFNTGYTPRGNVTHSAKWRNTDGAWIGATMQYDIAGNVVAATDALGHTSSVSYSSTYQYAYPTSTTSAIPNPGGVQGTTTALTTSTVYDFATGMVTSTTDANGQTTSYEYAATDSVGNANLLGRLTKVTRPTGGGWTSYEYGRNQYGDYVGVRTVQDASTVLWSYQLFDGLGRPYRSFQNDPADSSAQWLTVDTQYDALGRAKKVSNPYRSSGWADTDNASRVWTTNGYDALGRVTSVTTPDNAVVSTQYTGNSVLVTDQAGKQRKSYTDAQGRLTQVVEAPNDASFNYATNYTYDVLGNLRKVEQGQQTRFFMYDSLSRLIRAKNPEQAANSSITGTDSVTNNSQWSMSYGYDNNGNLQIRTDARGTVANYVYDNLNRNTTTYYSDGTTSAIQSFYDLSTNGKGRLWKQSVDNMTVEIPGYDAVGRATRRRETFWGGSYWRDYYVDYTYDQASHVTSMTYPSGHTVNYSYDGAGRTQGFTGYLGDGVYRSYASGIQYDEAGRMKQEQYGTNTPLFHKQHYNVRGQLYDVRLSSVNDEWNWNRGAIVNHYSHANGVWANSGSDDNGNVLRSHHYAPNDDAISGYALHYDDYTYDALNRIGSVTEMDGSGAQQFVQTFDYDRFGNRTINQAGTTQNIGINRQQFAVDAANNRLGVPAGQAGVMSYDTAGNLTTDTYSGGGTRSYDAENRMTRTGDGYNNQISQYVYDAGGKRVKRIAQGQEVWQVYGLEGELLAEYTSAGTAAPKEYGYRDGQLLITASPNYDAQAQSSIIVHLYQTILNRTPAPSEVQGWLNQGLTNVDAFKSVARQIFGSQEYLNRNRTDHEFVYDCYEAYLYREPDTGGWNFWTGLVPSQGRDNVRENGFASSQEFADRVASALAGETLWLTADQLGTPRIINDTTGSLANIKRHDYLPFGEELYANVGGRTAGQGYSGDSVNQKFTGKERDNETGLDYFGARYMSSTQGRFTSVDPIFLKKERLADPQRLDLYVYARNNPLKYVDPTGEDIHVTLTNVVIGKTNIRSATAKEVKQGKVLPKDVRTDTVSIYKVIVTNDSGSRFTTGATRDSNRNDSASQTRGHYGHDNEAPPGEYKGYFLHSEATGTSLRIYDPNIKDGRERGMIHSPDGPDRSTIQFHNGTCSEGCPLIQGMTAQTFKDNIEQLQAEDRNNRLGDDINVTIQDRNNPNTSDLPNGDNINIPETPIGNTVVITEPKRKP